MEPTVHVMEFSLECRDELRLCAMHRGSMVGVASVANAHRPTPTIYQLFVDTNYRKLAFGTELVRRAETEARERGAVALSAVVMESGPMRFWESLGYKPVHFECDRMIVSKTLT